MKDDPITPYREGIAARTAGMPITDNPYPRFGQWMEISSWQFADWREGWHKADAELPPSGSR